MILAVDVGCGPGLDELGPGCSVVPDEGEGLVLSDVTTTVLSGGLAVDIDDVGALVELGV